jgi:hypothetical protein
MSPGEIARTAIPSIVAMLVGNPELSPFLQRFPALTAGIIRATGAGTASGGADAGIQFLRGQPIDRSSLVRGAADAVGVGAGASAAGGADAWAEETANAAASRGVNSSEIATAKRAANAALGRHAAPEEAGYGRQMIEKRTPIGPPVLSGKSGPDKLTGRLDAAQPAHDALLNANRGVGYSWNRDIKTGLTSLRRQLVVEGDASKVKQFDDFVAGMDKLYGNKKANPKQLDELVNTWQKAKGDVSESDVTGAVKKRVYDQLQKTANEKLRSLTPKPNPAAPGRAGMGEVQALNLQMLEDMNLRDVLDKSWTQQVFHPAGAPTNVHPGSWLERMNPMSNPRYSSRAALLATHPAVQAGLTHVPPLVLGPLAEHVMELQRQQQQQFENSLRPTGGH